MKKTIILLLFLVGCTPQESPKPITKLDMKILEELERKYPSEPKVVYVPIPVYYQQDVYSDEEDYEPEEVVIRHRTISIPAYEPPAYDWQEEQHRFNQRQQQIELQNMRMEQQWQNEQQQFNQMNDWVRHGGR